MRALLFIIALAIPASGLALDRSRAARAAFMKLEPCPATGKHRGACPGYQVDHRIPLKCGGPDRPENMQWLTVEQHKAKTAAEAKDCRLRRASAAPTSRPAPG